MKKCKWSKLRMAFFFVAMLGAQLSFGQIYVDSDQAVDILIQEAESTLVERGAHAQGSDEYAMLSLEKDLYKYTAHYIKDDGVAVSEALDLGKSWLEVNASTYYTAITESQRTTLHNDLKGLLD